MLQVGVMEGVLKQPRARLFAIARELGFDGVEIEVRGDVDDLRHWSTRAGVSISSLLCDGSGMGDADPEQRNAARERLKRDIRIASDLGVPGILWPMFELTTLADAAAVQRFVADITECVADAEACGVVIAWENALNAADTLAIIESVASGAFRCYFDFANTAKRGADPVAELKVLAGLIYQVHAKNTNKQHLDGPGVDLTACLAELDRQGYEDWIVLETPAGDDPLESARHNLRVLRETWATVTT